MHYVELNDNYQIIIRQSVFPVIIYRIYFTQNLVLIVKLIVAAESVIAQKMVAYLKISFCRTHI